MDVAIIKYNSGNVLSVLYALERLGINANLTDDVEEIKKADKVIFPGQGEASSAMRYLRERNLDQLIKDLKQPFFGICLGQQLLCEYSEENDTECLGVFPVKVRKFPPADKVPHVGWNSLQETQGQLLEGINTHDYVYYVHSYFAEIHPEFTVAKTHYIEDFSALLQKDNFYAMQAHPEKSSHSGQKILTNFLKL
ncbi:imidazole glycerol phosphate synthase subunit HisH [Echinicola vietnamensis]|uniref:Imidazole glycerol phosphate synthase subunit HisH n=1 Tax=Echinicola vietnamensis (strain DSM 17526 / LMG 23754 / KMM 6221) TaxID=926556 RepID=L0G1N0_ECHVK|nr:imidazole glycerol phosphate synthase subunit HisH [Echinicola vietnamensis]AGA78760.1 imidazole glycerol phosphate synthase, glutamine amidotransferase subunit [Echinicola vietnamensis DSM 17526]